MEGPFDWDVRKAKSNRVKHGVSFEEAATVFRDVGALTDYDLRHSDQEDRWLTIGYSARHRLLALWYPVGGDMVRIIGCREVTRAERECYEEQTRR